MTYRFNVADLNAIETRVGAWLSGCHSLMQVFAPYTDFNSKYHPNGRDPYLAFAAQMYNIPYDKLWADYEGLNGKKAKGEAKRMRQIAKPGVLGAIYRLSGGGWGWSKKSYKDHGLDCNANEILENGKKLGKKLCDCPTIRDKIKTGMWGYAENMGVEMDQEQAGMIVRMFRDTYEEIPKFWETLEEAAADVLRGTNTVRRVGPNGCVVIDKIHIDGRTGDMLRMTLPSGRRLHYLDARLESVKMPWQDRDGNDVYRDAMVYAGTNQETKQWDIWVQTHGGKLFENLVQAIARDVLAVKLLLFEENECPVVGHVHDEGIVQVLNDLFSRGVDFMVYLMSLPVDWAPGLLLGADGFEDTFYHK